MDIRYSCNQRDFKRYTTEETRNEMLITGLYKADEVVAVYSHVDRMVTLGCMPVHEEVPIDKGIDVWANFGTHYFLERREIGIFNIGDGAGTITADGQEYHLNYKDCLYITKGNEKLLLRVTIPSTRPNSTWFLPRPIAATRTSSSPLSRPPSAPWAALRPATSVPLTSLSTPASSRPASCPWV